MSELANCNANKCRSIIYASFLLLTNYTLSINSVVLIWIQNKLNLRNLNIFLFALSESRLRILTFHNPDGPVPIRRSYISNKNSESNCLNLTEQFIIQNCSEFCIEIHSPVFSQNERRVPSVMHNQFLKVFSTEKSIPRTLIVIKKQIFWLKYF